MFVKSAFVSVVGAVDSTGSGNSRVTLSDNQ